MANNLRITGSYFDASGIATINVYDASANPCFLLYFNLNNNQNAYYYDITSLTTELWHNAVLIGIGQIEQPFTISRNDQIQVKIFSSHLAIAEIEKTRKGDVAFRIIIKGTSYANPQNGTTHAPTTRPDKISNQGECDIIVSKSTWIEEFLPKLQKSYYSLLQVEKLKSEQFSEAINHLNEAWYRHKSEDYLGSLVLCRKVLEAAKKEILIYLNLEKENTTKIDFNDLFRSKGTGEKISALFTKLWDLSSTGSHHGTTPNRSISELCILSIHGLLNLLIEQNKLNFSSSDELQRLLYCDILISELTYANPKIELNALSEKLIEIRKNALENTIDELRNELVKLNPANIHWFNRYNSVNYTVKKLDLKTSQFVTEQAHANIDETGVLPGTTLREIPENAKLNERVNYVKTNLEFWLTRFPVIVKKIEQNKYEVWSGNHRVMAAIQKGLKQLIVICIE